MTFESGSTVKALRTILYAAGREGCITVFNFRRFTSISGIMQISMAEFIAAHAVILRLQELY